MSKETQVTDWFPGSVNPVHVGEYEVRNSIPLHHNSRGRLVGSMFRWWDGKRWLTAAPGCVWSKPSIFGSHWTHEWRGLAAPAGSAA